MKDLKLFRCGICGNILLSVEDSGVTPKCCETPMEEINPNTGEDSPERHIPAVNRKDNTVRISVGSAAHPMTPAHFIKWIILKTDKNIYARELAPGSRPEADFCICGDECFVSAYEYCMVHGLWKVTF